MLRYLFLIFLIVFYHIPSFSQNYAKYYDENGLIAEISNDLETAMFHSLKGRIYKIKPICVEYDGGMDSLLTDIYSNVIIGSEYNTRIIVFILFDRKLKIKEIRYSQLPNQNIANLNCLHEYIDAIYKTGKKWKRKGKKHKHELAIFSLKIH